MAWMEVKVDLEVLAIQFASELNDSTLLKFILEIDEHRADLNFTKELAERLENAILEEGS